LPGRRRRWRKRRFCQHRQTEGLGFLGAHQDHRSSAVVQRRSVAGRDAAVLFEGRTQFAQRFGGGVATRLLVDLERHRIAFALRDQDRGDLIDKASGLNRGGGFLLRSGGEGVLLLAADLVFVDQILGSDAHVVIVERIPQTVADHRVDDLRVAHAQTGACARHHIVGQAHVFLAAGNDHLGVAATNRLRTQMQGFQARAANLVQGQRRHGERQAGLDRRLTRRVLASAGGQHLAHDHFINLRTVQTGLFQQLADHRRAQINGGHAGQRTLETADRGTRGGNNYDVLHFRIPHCAANCISGT
jgi:hypothetical protein